MGKKAPKGFGQVVYAHFKAPMQAHRGDAKGAVDTTCGAYGMLAGGIIGGPAGAAIGKVIAEGPGTIIDFYDTSTIKHRIHIVNCTTLTIEVD